MYGNVGSYLELFTYYMFAVDGESFFEKNNTLWW